MGWYILKRLLQAIPLLLGIVTVTFFITRLAPGDPMDIYLEPRRQGQVDPEVIELLRQKYGLDQPIHIQYVKWVANVARGDLGESFRHRRPVSHLLAEAIPYTLQLTILAILLDALVGISLGIISAVKQYTVLDKAITLGSLIIYAIPSFWLALMLIYLFAVAWGVLPAGGMQTIGVDSLADKAEYLVLPVLTLSAASAGGFTRYVRASTMETMRQDYIRTARAKGLPESRVVLKHALRNALIPVVTIVALSFGGLFSGALITETMFSYLGMGKLIYDSILGNDYNLALVGLLFATLLTLLANLAADVCYAWLDPRISYQGPA